MAVGHQNSYDYFYDKVGLKFRNPPYQRTINFTITFDPWKYTDIDTMWDAHNVVKQCFQMKRRYYQYYYFIAEKHEQNPKRWHLHGQIILPIEEDRFACWDNLKGMLHKKVGNTCFKWNNNEFESDSMYRSYFEYCFKTQPQTRFYSGN